MTSSSAPLGSYAHGTSEIPLLGETIGESLRRTAERCPAHEALGVGSPSYRATWGAIGDETTRAAGGLVAEGVAVGDRVGIWSPTRYEWTVAQSAPARIGAILVNVNPAYKPVELEYALRQSGM